MGIMVINFAGGFANNIYNFCMGYALAKELNYSIVFDITNIICGYRLDYFDIPDYKKIVHHWHGSVQAIDKGMEIWPYSCMPFNYISQKEYASIEDAVKLNNYGSNLAVADWHSLFDRYRYWWKYKDEIIAMFRLRDETDHPNIMAFRESIKNRVSVGVHLRRCGVDTVSYNIDVTDDYYRSAVVYFRRLFGSKALFCVFSDDIRYAMSVLGDSEDIRYIHFLGYEDADFEEFICLSLCDHRILNNNSTFSSAAEMINENLDKISIYQGDLNESLSIRKQLRVITLYIKLFFSKKREDKIRRIALRDRRRHEVPFGRRKIDLYRNRYEYSEKKYSTKRVSDIMQVEDTIDNAEKILGCIQRCELDFPLVDLQTEKQLRYKKFVALYLAKDYQSALSLGDNIWADYRDCEEFLHLYADLLIRFGYKKESQGLLRNSTSDKNIGLSEARSKTTFILDIGLATSCADYCFGMVELGSCLSKFGFNTYVIEHPRDDFNRAYIKEDQDFRNYLGVNMGFKCYEYCDDVLNRILKEIASELVVIVSRNPRLFDDKKKDENIKYVFFDFSDEFDPERCFFDNTILGEAQIMLNFADYVLTRHPENYRSILGHERSIISYKNENYEMPFYEIDGRYKHFCAHRMSERTMNIANALINTFKKCNPISD